mgnify:CR=1 FL=1
MAIKIIEHKHERKKIRYAVKFLCKCGCVFWADDEDTKIPKEFNWTGQTGDLPRMQHRSFILFICSSKRKDFCGLRYDYGD